MSSGLSRGATWKRQCVTMCVLGWPHETLASGGATVNRTGFERRTQRKRAAILDASEALFLERGIAEVAVTDIARQAQVSPVTIYNYFGTKQALVREVM